MASTDDGDERGTRPPKAKPRVVVRLPERRELRPEHREHLQTSGLSDETLELACLYSESHHLRLHELVERKWIRGCGNAIVFPFYLPSATEPHAFRVRADRPRVLKKKNGKERKVKYDQSDAYGVLVYFAPRARAAQWYGDIERVLYWTEGEKKALALDQLGYVTVGLTGVWNWLDADRDRVSDAERLHPHISKHVAIAGRTHVIVFDADARENDKVMMAAARLCGVLHAAGAARVLFVAPPLGDHAPKGIDDFFAMHGEQPTRALLDTAAVLEPADPKLPLQRLRTLKALRESPLDEALVLPDGYEIQRDGSLWQAAYNDNAGDQRVTRTPLFISRKLLDHYAGDERVELTYASEAEGGRWPVVCVPRKAIADTRTLVAELAQFGAPVTSTGAGKIVDWLEAFEHINARVIPRIACVSSLGWHAIDGHEVFVSNQPHIEEGADMQVAIDTRGDRRRVVEALKPRGSLDAHLQALRAAWNAEPICAAVICASFAAPLLKPLHAANFAIHLPGESSRGKTSMLKIAASVWGDPNSPHWLASWNVTAAGAEARAAMMSDLPQCYDEIGSGEAQAIERLMYTLINGGGRTRSSRDIALRETLTWRTIVLSTGEREIADELTATGVQVRVVQLPIAGFGKLSALQIDTLREACVVNSGAAGDAWAKSLVAGNDDQWKVTRAALATLTARLRALSTDPLQGRIAAYFALLAVTESMLADLFELGNKTGSTMMSLFDSLSSREEVVGVADRARELVEGWVLSEPDAFPELEMSSTTGELDAKSRGKTRLGFKRGDRVLLLPSALREFCQRHRLPTREVLRQWRALDWLDCDSGRLDKMVRLGSSRVRFNVFKLTRHDADTGFEP